MRVSLRWNPLMGEMWIKLEEILIIMVESEEVMQIIEIIRIEIKFKHRLNNK